ncbi:MAG: Flp family type IVb pilin [Cohaesibacter sp.]|jgi:Flp pilus assembly pilin Flp|nr:Flp family type IVb pilin [Cohaesibacter sp.]
MTLSRFGKDESGATAIEYSILMGCIALVLTGSLSLYSESIIGVFNSIAEALGFPQPIMSSPQTSTPPAPPPEIPQGMEM